MQCSARTVRALITALALAGLLFFAQETHADSVTAKVSLATQTMQVFIGENLMHEWPVSTARRGYRTPPGTYVPYWLDKNHRSRIYNNAPMPFSIFFRGGYAIHGTTETKSLGRVASHGCVRLLTENARTLYLLVEQYGMQNARVIIEP